MPIVDEIHARLLAEFAPTQLSVRDDSEAHRGHAGHREGGETHFHIIIEAAAFGPMSRIARHRAVHAALGPELVGRVHALGFEISGPPTG